MRRGSADRCAGRSIGPPGEFAGRTSRAPPSRIAGDRHRGERRFRPESFHLLINDISSRRRPPAATWPRPKFSASRSSMTGSWPSCCRRFKETRSSRRPCCCRCSSAPRRPRRRPIVLGYLEDSLRSGWRPSPDALTGLFDKLAEPDRARIRIRIQRICRAATQDRQSRLAEFLPLLEGGNAERGRAVFLSTKTACSTCHRVGSEGGRIGPDLTSIGAIRAGRDILESIVFPSSTIAQEFEQYTLVTTDGRAISGIMASQTADTLRPPRLQRRRNAPPPRPDRRNEPPDDFDDARRPGSALIAARAARSSGLSAKPALVARLPFNPEPPATARPARPYIRVRSWIR